MRYQDARPYIRNFSNDLDEYLKQHKGLSLLVVLEDETRIKELKLWDNDLYWKDMPETMKDFYDHRYLDYHFSSVGLLLKLSGVLAAYKNYVVTRFESILCDDAVTDSFVEETRNQQCLEFKAVASEYIKWALTATPRVFLDPGE